MRKAIPILAGLLAAVFPLGAGAAGASEFDRAMEPVLAEYLKIQTALANDRMDGVAAAVQAIEKLAKQLDARTLPAEDVEQLESIPEALQAACSKLEDAEGITAYREGFKDLSKPVSAWVTRARPAGTSVLYCPMAKAGWVQRGAVAANPYFGATMSSCGEKVGGAN